MKNAAKCDTSCDLQNPVNHQNFERTLRFRDIPGSMLVGVSVDTTRPPLFFSFWKPRVASGLCVFRSFRRLHCASGNPSECTESRERNLSSACGLGCAELLTALVPLFIYGFGDSRLDQKRGEASLWRGGWCFSGGRPSWPSLRVLLLSFGPPIKQEDPLNLSI